MVSKALHVPRHETAHVFHIMASQWSKSVRPSHENTNKMPSIQSYSCYQLMRGIL
jgi:hypothetical protein